MYGGPPQPVEYDSDSDNEPIESPDQFKDKHSCTDPVCCCVWVLALIALIGVFGYGLAMGNPKKLHHGIDSMGRVCGVDAGVELKPYTYFCPSSSWIGGSLTELGFDLSNPVCVAECPKTVSPNASTPDAAVLPALILECANATNSSKSYSTKAYATTSQLYYCLPETSIHSEAATTIAEGISGAVPTMLKFADSILKGWPIYITVFILAVFIGYGYLCCLKVFARILVWVAIIVAFLALEIIGGYLIYKAPTIGTNAIMSQFGQFATFMAYAIGGLCIIGGSLIGCMVCCCCGQIEDAVIAVQMTTDVMACIPSLLIAPVVKSILKFIVALILIMGLVYLFSLATPVAVQGSAAVRTFSFQDWQLGLIAFYLFMIFWVLAFLTAVYQFAVAYATADYYYSRVLDDEGDREVATCAVFEGMCVGMLWHAGSFAFGALIIAFFSMIQRTIEYIERSNPNNPVVKVITCCCYCCVTCCKGLAEFLNKNAYICIAIKSYPFCKAARKALEIIAKKAVGMAVLNGATFFFQIAGLLLITCICVFVAALMTQVGPFVDGSSSWFLPHPPVTVVVSGMIGFAMAKIFMDVFDMVSDTLMFCFGLENFDVNSYKCPSGVKEAMRKSYEADGQE